MDPKLVEWFASLRRHLQGQPMPQGQPMSYPGDSLQTSRMGLSVRTDPYAARDPGLIPADQMISAVEQFPGQQPQPQQQNPLRRQALMEGLQRALWKEQR